MDDLKDRPVYPTGDKDLAYMDIQAEVGITKHMEGYAATDALQR